MAARLYSPEDFQEAVINCLNISGILFTASNLVFAASFMKQEERKNAEGSAPRLQPFLLEYIICSPEIYIPRLFVPLSGPHDGFRRGRLWNGMGTATSVMNLLLLFFVWEVYWGACSGCLILRCTGCP